MQTTAVKDAETSMYLALHNIEYECKVEKTGEYECDAKDIEAYRTTRICPSPIKGAAGK